MNVTMPKKHKFTLKDKIVYITAIIVCLFTLVTIIIIEVKKDTGFVEILDTVTAEQAALGNKTEEEINALKGVINSKFNNNIEKKSVSTNIKKIDSTKDVICTALTTEENKQGSYELNVVLPVINVNSEIVKKYNKEIDSLFKSKLDAILKTNGKNIVYNTEYVASVNDSILSLMIRANIKEGSNAQRTYIKTYNYDLNENKELTLSDILKKNNIDENTVRQTIQTEIEKSQQRVEGLQKVGYSVYNRNPADSRYDIKNSKEFYCTSNTVYIVYAYGNKDATSEMDVVVL